MLPIIAYKVYCSDGTFYTKDLDKIPPDVQAVIFYHNYPYRTIEYGEDFYYVDNVKLYGKWMGEKEYYSLLDVVLNDFDIPK